MGAATALYIEGRAGYKVAELGGDVFPATHFSSCGSSFKCRYCARKPPGQGPEGADSGKAHGPKAHPRSDGQMEDDRARINARVAARKG